MFHFAPVLLLSSVLTMTFSEVCLGAVSSKNKPVYGHDQLETAKMWNRILPSQTYDTSPAYNRQYRPPTAEGEPIFVELSLNSFKITKFNFTTKTMRFTADLGYEFSDPRLAYDPPSTSTKFIKVPCYTDVWTPRLRLMDVEFTHEPETDLAENSETFVTPQGRVYRKVRVASEIIQHFEPINEGMNETVKNDRDRDMEFSMRFVGDQLTLDDMQFKWRAQKPVIVEVQTIRTSEGTWSIQPDALKCTREEDYGSFVGTREFTCLRLIVKLISLQI